MKKAKKVINSKGKLVYACTVGRKRDRGLTHQFDPGAHWADYRPKHRNLGRYAELKGNMFTHNGVVKYL